MSVGRPPLLSCPLRVHSGGPHPPASELKIAILGAGVSGLALARYLVEGGAPLDSLTLFEAASVVGGLCRSKTVDGFTYDVAGGHILYSKDAAAMQWMKDCAGGEAAFVKKARNTRIRFGDRWVNYPFENGIGDLPHIKFGKDSIEFRGELAGFNPTHVAAVRRRQPLRYLARDVGKTDAAAKLCDEF